MEKYSSEGHRKRLKEKYIKSGYDAFHEYEILEILLTYSIPRKDVKPIAKKLLEVFGSTGKIFGTDIKELIKIDDGRYSVGSRHQYSGAGSRTTGQ